MCACVAQSAVAVAGLGVPRVAGAGPAVHRPVATSLGLRVGGSRGRSGRRTWPVGERSGSGSRSGLGRYAGLTCCRLTPGRAAGAVPGVLGLAHGPLCIELAHRRLTSRTLRRGEVTSGTASRTAGEIRAREPPGAHPAAEQAEPARSAQCEVPQSAAPCWNSGRIRAPRISVTKRQAAAPRVVMREQHPRRRLTRTRLLAELDRGVHEHAPRHERGGHAQREQQDLSPRQPGVIAR